MTSPSEELVAGQSDLWSAMAAHPFVRAAADGSLTDAAFGRWLIEDHHFVVGFRRFLARLVDVAPTEHARDLLCGGLGALQPELELFRSEAAVRALDLESEPSPTTLGYTSYMLASPADGWPAALMVLYGAERAYFDAWTAVRASTDRSSPYWRFIDNWSSPAFGAWVAGIGRLVDGLAEPDLRTFRRVVRFELRFWDAVYRGESW